MREVAKLYGVPVILHTDHCMRSWLPWFDGMLEANEKYHAEHGEPLFSSHMVSTSGTLAQASAHGRHQTHGAGPHRAGHQRRAHTGRPLPPSPLRARACVRARGSATRVSLLITSIQPWRVRWPLA